MGKLLRIDVESTGGSGGGYTIPQTNPLRNLRGVRPEIWAAGLRNPWRFSFDRDTGDLWIGDVGQGKFEEIDFQPHGSRGGLNYGWRLREGNADHNIPSGFPPAVLARLVRPVIAYSHDENGATVSKSVTGGFVYRGAASARMSGKYFYADFETGTMWALAHAGSRWRNLRMVTSPRNFSSFGEDEAGELYAAAYDNGTIYRLADTGAARTPFILPNGGSSHGARRVRFIEFSPGAAIHFTTDGSDPTEADPVVPASGVLTVSRTLALKARAFRDGLDPSGVAAARFTVQ